MRGVWEPARLEAQLPAQVGEAPEHGLRPGQKVIHAAQIRKAVQPVDERLLDAGLCRPRGRDP
jgi:hypothetical protein